MVSTHEPDLVGRVLGDFQILEPLGTGGMGTVYRALQRGMQRNVAIKVLPPEMAANQVLLQRFYQEARSAARLDHPGIVRAITVGEQDGMHYFAMEYVEGETLSQRIARSGHLDEPEAVRIVAALAEALAAAHSMGMVHRDVKPENVLLTSDGRIKLTDFGLVKRRDQDLGLTQAGKGLGTVNYMAPEQFKDAKHADPACDIYSLGATLYAALTGQAPWKGVETLEMYQRKRAGDLPPVRHINSQVSLRIEAVIARATCPEPSRRQANCSELLAELAGTRHSDRSHPPEEAVTRAALELPPTPDARPGEPVDTDLFFVRFFDHAGKRKQIRLRCAEIRQGIKSGRLAANMRLSRSEQGPWLPPNAYKEFVDLLASLSRGTKETAMESDIERTVAALRAGAPLRRRERHWKRLIWIALTIALLGLVLLALWATGRDRG